MGHANDVKLYLITKIIRFKTYANDFNNFGGKIDQQL